MSRESTRRQFLAAGGAAGAVALAGCGGGGISGGGNGTIDWYFANTNKQLSKELVSLINTRDDVDIKLRKGGTAADAVKRLNDETGEFAVVGADVASFAKNGAGMQGIGTKYKKIRAMMALYPMPVTVVARPDLDVETVGGLSGQTVNIGKTNSRLATNAKQILNKSNADFSVTNLSLSNAMAKLEKGSLDATFAIGDWPMSAIQDVAPNIKTLSLSDQLRADVAGSTDWFVQANLPAGVYDGVDYMTPTVGMMALLVTHEEVSSGDIAGVTVRVLKSAKNGDVKTRSSYIPGRDELDKARKGIPSSVPLHDGAKQVLVYD